MANNCDSSYISRRLSKTLISCKFLRNVSPDTLIVIDCLNDKEKTQDLRLKLKTFEYLQPNWTQNRHTNILLAENKCSIQNFHEISSKSSKFTKFHHFKVANSDALEWLHSEGKVNDLVNFLVVNETDFVEENHFYNSENNSKINLLTGEPGAGKTSLMKRIDEKYVSNFWTVFLNRTDMIALAENPEHFEKYVLEKECPVYDTNRKMLQVLIANNQIVSIWDGIDEIVPENVESISELISKLSRRNFTQWVTARTYLQKHLEDRFQVFAKHLKMLNTDELKAYARESLAGNYNETDFKELFELMASDIFAIPLHLFMLVEVLKRGLKLSKKSLNLTDLYQHFIDEKFNILFAEKSNHPAETRAMQDMRNTYKSVTFKHLQEAAGYILVPELNLRPEDFLQGIKEEGDSLGFIMTIEDHNNPHFVHIGYAEYLVATYFVEHYKLLANFKEVLFQERLTNVRFFFDLLLAKNSEAHVAFLQRNFQELKKQNFWNRKDSGGRSVLHLAASWGFRYPKIQILCVNDIHVIQNGSDFNQLEFDSEPYSEILQDLVDRCDASDKDEVFEMDPLGYAETSQCLLAKVKLLVKQGKQFVTLNDDLSLAGLVFYQLLNCHDDLFRLYDQFPMIHDSLYVRNHATTILHRAVDDPNILDRLLKIDSFTTMINAADRIETPLHRACRFGLKKSVQLLVARGADLEPRDTFGKTPFVNACMEGYTDIAKLLLHSNVNASDDEDKTALHYACSGGHQEVAEFLLQLDVEIDAVDKDGNTPFLMACDGGHFETAKLLLQKMCNPHATNQRRRTALHQACAKGDKNIVEHLLQWNLEIDAVDENSDTPLMVACDAGNTEVVKFLLGKKCNAVVTNSRGRTALHQACSQGFEKVVELLLQLDLEIDAVDENGETPLMSASKGGNIEIVKLLLDKDCNQNAVDKRGQTALHYACYQNCKDLVEVLLRFALEIDPVNDKGETPLIVALKGQIEVANLLLRKGCQTNVTDEFGCTPLHHASTQGYKNIVEILLNQGLTVNDVDKKGFAPLHYASCYGHYETVKVLAEFGADVNLTNISGNTPLNLACKMSEFLNFKKEEYFAIAELLVKLEANIHAPDNNGITPLAAATDTEWPDLVNLLKNQGNYQFS